MAFIEIRCFLQEHFAVLISGIIINACHRRALHLIPVMSYPINKNFLFSLNKKGGIILIRHILLIFSVLFLIVSCTGKSKEELLAEGLKLLNENQPSGAIVLFKNALEKDQNYFEARKQLAKAYMSAGKFDQAGQEYQKLLRMDPSAVQFQLELAKAYLSAGKTAEALKEVAGFMESQPRSPEALEIRGYAQTASGDPAAGEKSLLEALKIEPERPTAKLGLAIIYNRGGKTAEAEALLNQTIKKDEKNLKAYYLLAGIQAANKQQEKALGTYREITKLAPAESEAIYRSGLIYVDSADYTKADQTANDLITKFPKAPLGYALKGIISYFRNDFAGAITVLQQSISIRPTIGAYYFLGMAYYQKGENELALSQFQKILDYNPANVQSRIFLSLIHLRQKRFDSAISELKRVIQDNPELAFAHNLLGSTYLQKGMNEEGMRELNSAIQIDPKLVDAHLKKGMFSLSMGNFKEAETELRTAVNVAPDILNSRLLLTAYYMGQMDYPKAMSILRDGLTGTKSDAILYNNMAAVLSRENKIPEALVYLHKAKELDPNFFDAYFNTALYYAVKGENDKALNEYRAVLQRSERNVRAMVSMAMLLEVQGKESDAAWYYAKAKETKEPKAYLAHAGYYIRKKDTQNALAVAEALLAITPASPEALELKGRILFGAQRYKEALTTFDQLETVQPYRGLPFIVNVLITMKDYPAALKRLDTKLAANPDKVVLRAEMARLYVLMGDEKKAVESANKIMDPWKGSAFGYVVLSSVYESFNKPDSALDALKKGVQVDGKNMDARLKLGDLYAKQKDYPQALKIYESALKINNRAPGAYFAMGTVYEKMGKPREAAAKYRQVLDKSENNVAAMNNLAFLYLQGLGSNQEALELAMRAYRESPEAPQILDTLGYALVKNNRPKEAFELLRKAAGLLPDDPSVQYHLSLVYKASGDTGHAREALARALKQGDFPEAKEARLLLDKLGNAN
jgi:putative PEP-CTERM system TPR-repeat lipoprotein